MRRLAREAAWIAAAATFLLWPAFYNGYPLLHVDSADYILLSLLVEPVPYRTLPYALLIRPLHGEASLWPVVVAQAGLTAWVLRAAVLGLLERRRDLVYAVLILVLAVATGLPWFVSQVMPDLFAGLGLLALALLLALPRPGSRTGLLTALAALALACHASHALAGLLLLAAAAIVLARRRAGLRPLLLPGLAVALGIVAVPAVNLAAGAGFFYSRGGEVFLLGRMVQDGLAKRYLDARCPDPGLTLCAYRDRLPATHNDFLWNRPEAFAAMGGWDAAIPEARRIVRESLLLFPLAHLRAALEAGAIQLVTLRTGSDIGHPATLSTPTVETVFPHEAMAYHAALQQRRALPFEALNRWQVPIQLAALAGLAALVAMAALRGRRRQAGFGALLLASLAANALVCGALSNPQDRYQSRVAWLAALGVGIAVGQALAARAGPARPAP